MCQEHVREGEAPSQAHVGHDREHIEHDNEHREEADADRHKDEAALEDVHEHAMTARDAGDRRPEVA